MQRQAGRRAGGRCRDGIPDDRSLKPIIRQLPGSQAGSAGRFCADPCNECTVRCSILGCNLSRGLFTAEPARLVCESGPNGPHAHWNSSNGPREDCAAPSAYPPNRIATAGNFKCPSSGRIVHRPLLHASDKLLGALQPRKRCAAEEQPVILALCGFHGRFSPDKAETRLSSDARYRADRNHPLTTFAGFATCGTSYLIWHLPCYQIPITYATPCSSSYAPHQSSSAPAHGLGSVESAS